LETIFFHYRQLVFITSSINAKPNLIEIDFENIKSCKKFNFLFVNDRGLVVNLKNGQNIKFFWVADTIKYLNQKMDSLAQQ
jgi:hypothetical protein